MDDVKNSTNTTTTAPTNEVDPVFAQIEGELKTRFELLPTELQQVILSSDYQMKLFEVAKKHKLTYEKLGQLELETTMVILGMTPPEEYKIDIAEQMGLSGEALDSVVTEINEQVFSPIREKLMMLYNTEDKGDSTPTQTPQPTTNPYREPIPGINTGAVPTSEKNDFDSKKEVGLNPSINPVKIGLDTTPIGTAPVQPVAMPAAVPQVDPYRELPETTPMPMNSGVPQVKTAASGIDTSLTQEFLKTIPTLGSSETSKPARATTESALEIAKTYGAVDTMPKAPQAKVALPENQAEKLQNIADLKSVLGAKFATPEIAAPVAEPVVAPQTPIVTKEIQSPKVAQMVSPVQTQFAPLPQTQAPVNTNPLDPKFSPEETGELVRNIKLQLNETEHPGISPETLQKIDSMIDFKKAGTFMKDAADTTAHMGSGFAAPAFQKPVTPTTSSNFLDKNTQSGEIFEKSITNLDVPVKKTGFFGKMKNFFGGKTKIQSQEQPQTVDTTVHTFSGMPAGIRLTPSTPAPQTTAHDEAVDNVKIFDEVTVSKK